MKILLEKNILNDYLQNSEDLKDQDFNSLISEINKLTGQSREDKIKSIVKEIYPNLQEDNLSFVADYISKKGWEDNKNIFLKFIPFIKEELPEEGLQLIATWLDNKYLEANDTNFAWLSNSDYHNPIYKLKTLALLHNEEAFEYFEEDQVPLIIEEVGKMKYESDIRDYISNMQTRDGEAQEKSLIKYFLDDKDKDKYLGDLDKEKIENLIKSKSNLNSNEGKTLISHLLLSLYKDIDTNLNSQEYSQYLANLLNTKVDNLEPDKEQVEDQKQNLNGLLNLLLSDMKGSIKDAKDKLQNYIEDSLKTITLTGNKLLLQELGLEEFAKDTTPAEELRKIIRSTRSYKEASEAFEDNMESKFLNSLLGKTYEDYKKFLEEVLVSIIKKAGL